MFLPYFFCFLTHLGIFLGVFLAFYRKKTYICTRFYLFIYMYFLLKKYELRSYRSRRGLKVV